MAPEAFQRCEFQRAEVDRVAAEIRALGEALADFDTSPRRCEEFEFRREQALARLAQVRGELAACEAATNPA